METNNEKISIIEAKVDAKMTIRKTVDEVMKKYKLTPSITSMILSELLAETREGELYEMYQDLITQKAVVNTMLKNAEKEENENV